MTEAKVKITVKNGKITTAYYGNEAQGTNAIAVSLAKQLALLVMGGALTEEEAEDGLRRLKERYQRFLMQMSWEEIRDE